MAPGNLSGISEGKNAGNFPGKPKFPLFWGLFFRENTPKPQIPERKLTWGVAEGAGGVPSGAGEAAEFGEEKLGGKIRKIPIFCIKVGKCQGSIKENYREKGKVCPGLVGNGGRISQFLKFMIPKIPNS